MKVQNGRREQPCRASMEACMLHPVFSCDAACIATFLVCFTDHRSRQGCSRRPCTTFISFPVALFSLKASRLYPSCWHFLCDTTWCLFHLQPYGCLSYRPLLLFQALVSGNYFNFASRKGLLSENTRVYLVSYPILRTIQKFIRKAPPPCARRGGACCRRKVTRVISVIPDQEKTSLTSISRPGSTKPGTISGSLESSGVSGSFFP